MRHILASMAAALLVTGALSAAPEVSMRVEPRTATIGDLLSVTVTFDLPPDHEAIVPGEDADLGAAEVRSVEQSTEPLADGGQSYSVAYTAALWEVGEITLTSPTIAMRGPEGEITELEATTAAVTITSVLQEGAQDIQDIRGPKEIPLRWQHYMLAALPVILLIGLIALLVWWLRSRNRSEEPEEAPAPPLPPAEEALAALAELERDDLVGQGLIKEHYVRLSWILRNYAERRWHVSALEETTGMLQRTMLGSGRVGESVVDQITAILRRADLAKFAKHCPAADEAREDIERVREIVRTTRPRQEVAEDVAPDEAVASPAG